MILLKKSLPLRKAVVYSGRTMRLAQSTVVFCMTLAAVVPAVSPAVASDEIGFHAGVKLWQVGSDYSEDTMMYGVSGGVDLPHGFWISGMYLQGEFEYATWPAKETEQDGEIVFGKSFELFDVGAGFRYTKAHTSGWT